MMPMDILFVNYVAYAKTVVRVPFCVDFLLLKNPQEHKNPDSVFAPRFVF